MTQRHKKFRERAHLERFLRLLAEPTPIRIEEGESPDFIVHWENDAHRVGIEVTELHRPGDPGGQSLQAQGALRSRIVRRAEECHRATGRMPTAATVGPER